MAKHSGDDDDDADDRDVLPCSIMERIGVRELRQHASRYLDRVKAGEIIEVTEYGTPVARLVPIKEMSRYDRMVASGEIIPGDGRDILDTPPLPLELGERPPSEVLQRMRDSERF